jgi:hypothetical protein
MYMEMDMKTDIDKDMATSRHGHGEIYTDMDRET